MRYLLDTNICIYLIKQKSSIILEKLKNAQPLGVGISSITLSELEYGVQKSTLIDRNALNLLQFLTLFNVVPFDESAARIYGKIRATLERKGQLIGGMDMLIGAHSLSMNAILVTNNMREFKRIDGLQLENWTKE
jgi:tRNA(fMet)-specific endonuclease VapC